MAEAAEALKEEAAEEDKSSAAEASSVVAVEAPDEQEKDPGEAKEEEAPSQEIKTEDSSELFPGETEESTSQSSANKKIKIEIKEKKEKKHKNASNSVLKLFFSRILVSSFSEEQLNRYEMYRRSAFPKAAIKRVRLPFLCSALDVCEKWGESPPLQPKHMREAVRRLKSRGQIPNSKYKKILFH
ncbi:hypothetical protein JD844_018295 [Phrynosoma platyrhinos]|uniref:TAFII28-like protein domain-containing protein n=1 Tax=Phrynosoma platyrhinos TaxID=52577 RepID=A0ABQ7SN82_PHRPL|nr:hypothetical protein JD844_018295 [Phrynosoma platyrhinos]